MTRAEELTLDIHLASDGAKGPERKSTSDGWRNGADHWRRGETWQIHSFVPAEWLDMQSLMIDIGF